MYTKIQREIISYTRAKIKSYMENNPAAGHGSDHAIRVAMWAFEIAKKEKANIFLCELGGLLHDVGRSWENTDVQKRRHHELSYEICRDWFKNDKILFTLTNQEKLILLYSIRYHWNNAADKYFEAVVLRDADKLDAFGKIGIKRTEEFFNFDREKTMDNLRLREHDMFWLRTGAARSYFEKHKMFDPILKYMIKKLKEDIRPVEL